MDLPVQSPQSKIENARSAFRKKFLDPFLMILMIVYSTGFGVFTVNGIIRWASNYKYNLGNPVIGEGSVNLIIWIVVFLPGCFAGYCRSVNGDNTIRSARRAPRSITETIFRVLLRLIIMGLMQTIFSNLLIEYAKDSETFSRYGLVTWSAILHGVVLIDNCMNGEIELGVPEGSMVILGGFLMTHHKFAGTTEEILSIVVVGITFLVSIITYFVLIIDYTVAAGSNEAKEAIAKAKEAIAKAKEAMDLALETSTTVNNALARLASAEGMILPNQ